MTRDDLRALWTAVWAFRAEMGDAFPTPPRNDALAFAFTEGVGESLRALHGWPEKGLDAAMVWASDAIDAELRLNPRYDGQRNNDRDHSIERELTQCAMLLLTAVPRTWNGWGGLDFYDFVATWTVRNIAIRVGRCLEVSSDIEYILGTVQAINTAVDLSVTLPAELDRMRAKHKPANGFGSSGFREDLRRMGELYDPQRVAGENPTDDDNGYTHGGAIAYVPKRERLVVADCAEGAGVE